MILGIDHIGLGTDDAEGVGDVLRVLGLGRSDGGQASGYGVACEFWRYPAAAPSIEVNSPLREGSALDGLLSRDRAGLYHIALEVDDLEADLQRLRDHGLVAVDREPQAGARPGMRVAFVYARKPAALLIELVEYETRRSA